MSCNLPVPIRADPPPPPLPARIAEVDLVGAFLAGRNPHTLRAYARDLADFAGYLGQPSADLAVELLLSLAPGDAHALALGYRAHLADRRLAAATVARRLAALRSMVKLARQLGRVGWALEIESPRGSAYRDTRGPGRDGYKAMLAAAEGDTPRAVRDRAILRALHDLGLRRGELVALDLADLDLEGSRVSVLGKGRSDREWLTLPGPTAGAIRDWLIVRGDHPGPLFHRLDRARPGGGAGRLTGEAVRLIVRGRALAAGIARPVRPHGLRHLAVTTALDMTNGDVRTVQKFSRHKSLDVLMIYDDRRGDVAGDVARKVAAEG